MTGARQEEASARTDRRWLFGAAALDERTLELVVDGQAVDVERKSLQILMHLLNHAGEVVTKDELLAAVWPGRILSDSVLTSCMARLRDAIRDESQGLIKTVHGYGYRLIAPVKVEASAAAAPARFEFKPGEHLPARPLWSLVERLGTGGQGEAWLAKHDKTHERRVYKFAADGESLVMLKREITIYRLLHDSLGDRRDLVQLLDWNLDEPPCFLEYAYVEGGSLAAWANAQGGPDRVPLATRLDLAIQVAEALGAAHSVGVLHKDLKPSNVLIERRADGNPQVKLCDFGSGGVLDVGRLERMGITRMGFTKTVAHAADAATPLYLAPEVAAGQPFTVQADIYALGVLLYQLAVGNFHKALAPGWELDVADELLREDIALAAEGHPERRIADAVRLAQRLRTLEQRRGEREAERAAKAEAERAQLEIVRVRARRVWVRLALALLVAGVLISSLLYVDARRARDAAAQAAATSRAVTAFLSQDMFAQIGGDQRPVRDLTVKQLLDGAAARVAQRFADDPQAAAEVHLALGASYEALDDVRGLARELDGAMQLLAVRGDESSETALGAATKLIVLKYVLGQLRENIDGYAQVRHRGRERHGAAHAGVLQLGQQLAYGHYMLGDWPLAAEEYRRVLADAAAARAPDEAFIAATERMLGQALLQLGEFAQAEEALRRSLERHIRMSGEAHVRVAQARTFLAEVLTETGRYAEAEAEIRKAVDASTKWAPSQAAAYVARARTAQGRLHMEQGRYAEAEQILEDSLRAYLAQKKPEERDQSATQRRPLAETYQRHGRLADAEREMRLALASAETFDGPDHPATQRMRIGLVDILRERGQLTEARAELGKVRREALARLPARHPLLGMLRRVEGLLLGAAGNRDAAHAALTEAYAIFATRYGEAHWRTRRARQELADLSSATGGRP